jgi:REP element-mobilizing transposase RayT
MTDGPLQPHWHHRGYLPHFDRPELIQSITLYLDDALPKKVIDKWRAELKLFDLNNGTDNCTIELHRRIARYGDLGRGACWLKEPFIGNLTEESLLHFDGKRYKLIAWCVMPNHLHTLIESFEGFSIGNIVKSWKSYIANRANRYLDRHGRFWQPDYYDRYIRDSTHFHNCIRYIENNPVKAGLCLHPEDWRWSSARRILPAQGKLHT